uniref:RNase H domain-containing protein n=1 Tax=Trichuris muris TaxID=70415 RepID=A0A5S6Q1Z5_TRIMR
MDVDGTQRIALVDTGCSRCIAHMSCCRKWKKRRVSVIAVDGKQFQCKGIGIVRLQPAEGGTPVEVEVIVTSVKPLGFDFVLGMNGIAVLGGVPVDVERRVRFGLEKSVACVATVTELRLDERDFAASHNHDTRSWTTLWKWSGSRSQASCTTPQRSIRQLKKPGPPMKRNCRTGSRIDGFVKRRINDASASWDEVVDDRELRALLLEIADAMKKWDPAQGIRDISGDSAKVEVDASALGIGVALEVSGSIIEDAAWLRPHDSCHINMAELDAVIKGLNLVLTWQMKKIELITNSATVHRWISDSLSGRTRLKTKAASEMLIRRRVGLVLSLGREYNLDLTITLVRSADNKVDALTRVPQRLCERRRGGGASSCVCGGWQFDSVTIGGQDPPRCGSSRRKENTLLCQAVLSDRVKATYSTDHCQLPNVPIYRPCTREMEALEVRRGMDVAKSGNGCHPLQRMAVLCTRLL